MGDLFDEVAFFYFKNLGYTTFEQVEKLTLPEINLQMKAFKEKSSDEEGQIYALSYLINVAGSTKSNGRAKYPTFKSFYDPDKARGHEGKSALFNKVVEYRKKKGVA